MVLAEYEYGDKSGAVPVIGQTNQSDSENRLANSENETLLSKLSEARNATGDDHLSSEEIEDQILTMIFAGYETTAATLAFALHSLATNPDVCVAFHDELDTVLNGKPPTRADMEQLDLTNRIVTETLRLYPPIHTIPRQTTRDVDIGRYRLPSDEQIHLSVIATHRNEQYYDEPLEFRPERWTNGSEEELDEYAFILFGGGRRTCIGREFARLEATLALATTGQQFAFKWEGEDSNVAIELEMTTKTQNGLPMSLVER